MDPRTELFGNIIAGDRHGLAVLARIAAPRGWLRGPHVQHLAGQNYSRCVRCRSCSAVVESSSSVTFPFLLLSCFYHVLGRHAALVLERFHTTYTRFPSRNSRARLSTRSELNTSVAVHRDSLPRQRSERQLQGSSFSIFRNPQRVDVVAMLDPIHSRSSRLRSPLAV